MLAYKFVGLFSKRCMYVLTDFARWFVLDRGGNFLTYSLEEE